jgi:hypothetical protein
VRLIHDDLARADRALSLQRLARHQQALRVIAAVRAARRADRIAAPGYPAPACSKPE